MGKSVYSLVLDDGLVACVDRLAYEKMTNRSVMINQILAAHFSYETPEQRTRRIFSQIQETLTGHECLRPIADPSETLLALRSSLVFKYNPTVRYSVELFRSLDIPVRQLECCSGDLADLKVKSVDVEAWSPRQQKYFEVGSCSNLGDAQARRLGIRIKNKEKGNYFAHTLNNTVVAPPRTLIAFLENNLKADGTIAIPEPLRMYMGGKEYIG